MYRVNKIPVLDRNTEFQSDTNLSENSSNQEYQSFQINSANNKSSKEHRAFLIEQLKAKLSKILVATRDLNKKFQSQCNQLENQIHENEKSADFLEENIRIYQQQILAKKKKLIKDLNTVLEIKKQRRHFNDGIKPYCEMITPKKSEVPANKKGTNKERNLALFGSHTKDRLKRSKLKSTHKRNRSEEPFLKMRCSEGKSMSREKSQKKLRPFVF